MRVRAYWYAESTTQEIEIPGDVGPEELDDYVRDHLELPSVLLDYWDGNI